MACRWWCPESSTLSTQKYASPSCTETHRLTLLGFRVIHFISRSPLAAEENTQPRIICSLGTWRICITTTISDVHSASSFWISSSWTALQHLLHMKNKWPHLRKTCLHTTHLMWCNRRLLWQNDHRNDGPSTSKSSFQSSSKHPLPRPFLVLPPCYMYNGKQLYWMPQRYQPVIGGYKTIFSRHFIVTLFTLEVFTIQTQEPLGI